MKTRKGFVSNSSSSSFIVDLHPRRGDEKYTLEKVKEVMSEIIEGYAENPSEHEYHTKEEIRNCCTIKVMTKKDLKYFEERLENGCKEFIGKILIDSIDDNSIPSEIQDEIEGQLNAHRFYWG